MVTGRHEERMSGRAWRVGRMGAGLIGSYLGYQLQNIFLSSADRPARQEAFRKNASRRTREEMESMKGPIMKIGQMLSMQDHWLAPETVEELSRLQARAPAMHPTLARARFRAALGQHPERIFRDFSAEPFAAASLGQVHRATTRDGESVVVKIQYPAIRQAIANDFALLRSATMPGRFSGYFPKSLVDEMEKGILQETDYRREANNIEFFREKIRALGDIRVPKVFREWSTETVLTMSHVDGVGPAEWLKKRPAQARRDELGKRLLELFNYQVHWMHALHADPHPGNYLIDEKDRVGLVDFGCVKYLSPATGQLARCFVDRVWKKGASEIRKMAQYAWNPRSKDARARAIRLIESYVTFADLVYPDPDETENTTVDFSKPTILQQVPDIWQITLRNRMSNPEFVFFCRAELGLYNLLHTIGARIDTARITGELQAKAGPVKG